VSVNFGPQAVCVTVTNPASGAVGGLAAGVGSGYGLQGMRERVLALGGRVDAGPSSSGWRVQVEVPA
jgi:signal transduction histidine kinase